MLCSQKAERTALLLLLFFFVFCCFSFSGDDHGSFTDGVWRRYDDQPLPASTHLPYFLLHDEVRYVSSLNLGTILAKKMEVSEVEWIPQRKAALIVRPPPTQVRQRLHISFLILTQKRSSKVHVVLSSCIWYLFLSLTEDSSS